MQADTDVISVTIPHNVTTDVSGNKNAASNILLVRHYSVPLISLVVSTFVNITFAVTCLVSVFLTVSTSSLLSIGAFSRPSSSLSSDPTRNLFRIAYHIQVFALSRWLAVTLPVEYYEMSRGLQWSIPYYNLPWESGNVQPVMAGSSSPMVRSLHSSRIHDSVIIQSVQPVAGNPDSAAKVYGLPLTPLEYSAYFESKGIMPRVDYLLDPQNAHGWRDFSRSMFWLAVIAGGLILLHVFSLFVLKSKRKDVQKWSYGALVFPRLEIFLLMLSLPGLSASSAAIVKGTTSGIIVGVLILGLVAFLLLSVLLFLSIGIIFGKKLQYKEVQQEDQKFHWYQELIRLALGPGKRGQWTWKNQPRSIYVTVLGPLFEDLSGPPEYMVSQIEGGGSNKKGDRILASDDETKDAEGSFIQKVSGTLRIYYTLLECVKRVVLGTIVGAYSKGISCSRTPSITLLSVTSFQLFFMILKKPFIKKRVQFVEIISVSSEVAIFVLCLVLLDHEYSPKDETKLGISMISVFLLAFIVQMINEWYALHKQMKHLDPMTNSFFQGLTTALIGLLLLLFPHDFFKNLHSRFPIYNLGETGDTTSSGDRHGSSGSRSSSDKSLMRRIIEMTRSSFSKEGNNKATPNDPSTSKTGLSGLWRSGSSTASTSADFRSKSKGLFKELEDIFASDDQNVASQLRKT